MTRSALLLASTAALFATAARAAPQASDLGPVAPGTDIAFSVELKRPAQPLFDRTLAALYDPASASFHHWLTPAQLRAFAPPAAQADAVIAALQRAGLAVTAREPDGVWIQAHGPAAAVGRAFATQLHQFQRGADRFRAPLTRPTLADPAGAAIKLVTGLESHTIRPLRVQAIDQRTGRPYAPTPVETVRAAGGLGSVITDDIVGAPASFTYTNPLAPFPTATYSGTVYNPSNPLVPDYTPAQLQSIYHLTQAYNQGLTGRGQTIVLLEAFGYPQMQTDANAFYQLTGLPQLTASNFSVVYPEGMPVNPYIGDATGWNGEIALDLDWSHAIAPGANIVLVATKGQDSEPFLRSMRYIIQKHLGNAVSDSWEENLDLVTSPEQQDAFEDVLKVAAAEGISFQFSSGDGGDEGVGSPIGSAGVPAVAPHATAVGGTAILNSAGGGFVNIGWGNVGGIVAKPAGPVIQPTLYFLGGGGGGSSIYWPKPAWQAALPGNFRQTPDISALSDPYTGVPTVITVHGKQGLYPGNGGTSLGSPIFTAIWAIANQQARHPLGQAAPIVAALTTGVTDIVPATTAQNVGGEVETRQGSITYTTQDLFGPFTPGAQPYPATITNQSQAAESFVLGFSLDTTLEVAKGWDNATGYGTPDGLAFIKAAAAYR
jgi:subtilase family serine protease